MRLVIKIGTQVLAGKTGLDTKRIGRIVSEISELIKAGHKVALVSSGAIGAGLPTSPAKDPQRKKIAASVGQPLLMQQYINHARKFGLTVGQILILSEDLTHRERFKNFGQNIEAMLRHKILPIINENDVMKTEDLLIGDNDKLGAIVAAGLKAKKFLILTNQNGLYTKNPDRHKNAELVKWVKDPIAAEKLCTDEKSELGVGGMLSKIRAARYASSHGVEVLIGNGNEHGIIKSALRKKFPGTRFAPKRKTKKMK